MAYFPEGFPVGSRVNSVVKPGVMATLKVGSAVKIDRLPVDYSNRANTYAQVTQAGAADLVLGTVLGRTGPLGTVIGNFNDSSTDPGQVGLLAGGPLPVLLAEAVVAGDKLKVTTAAGEWGKAGAATVALLEALEAGAAAAVIWARPLVGRVV